MSNTYKVTLPKEYFEAVVQQIQRSYEDGNKEHTITIVSPAYDMDCCYDNYAINLKLLNIEDIPFDQIMEQRYKKKFTPSNL